MSAVFIGCVALCPLFGQQPDAQAPPKEPAPPEASQPQPAPGNSTVLTQAENAAMKPVALFDLLEKKSFVFPDIANSTQALSVGQKFELFIDNSISVHAAVWSTLGSLIGQAADSPTGFPVGGDGYLDRLSTSLARESSGQFFGTFIVASALHQDPRFFPQHRPSFKQSVKYSFQQLFITRSDAGNTVINAPGLLGPLFAESLANVYWPDRNRTVGDTLLRYGIDTMARAGGNMFRNYWPVIVGKLSHAQINSEPRR